MPGVVFSCTPGAPLGDGSRHRGRVISEQDGVHIGEGAVSEGRITKAVIGYVVKIRAMEIYTEACMES